MEKDAEPSVSMQAAPTGATKFISLGTATFRTSAGRTGADVRETHDSPRMAGFSWPAQNVRQGAWQAVGKWRLLIHFVVIRCQGDGTFHDGGARGRSGFQGN